jgi:hypothetical protein
VDRIAQDAFVFLWETLARRFRRVPSQFLSFNLLNEPPAPGGSGLTRENHAALIRRTVAAIRAIDPARRLVIDGLGGGFLSLPELANLGVTHSARGYHPMPVSHHRASWWADHMHAPAPKYPGLRWQGRVWNRAALRDSYRTWRGLERRGVEIHIGEFGCFNRTPNDILLRWLCDLLSVYREFQWGYALWQFRGPFGILDHGRPGASLEWKSGYQVDRTMIDLLIENRV